MRPIDSEKIRRLLIRGTNWVGDAVMSVPALREIRRIFSRAHISLLVRPWVRDVYGKVDFVDQILEFDKSGRHAGLKGTVRMAAELRAHSYDAAILLQNAFEAAVLAYLSRIPIRAGYGTDGRSILLTHRASIHPATRTVHQSYYYLDLLSGLGLAPPRLRERNGLDLNIHVGVREEHRESARKILRESGLGPSQRYIGVNPGAAYGAAKRWITDRYAALADALALRFSARPVLFGSAGDRSIAAEVASLMRSHPIVLAGRTSLGEFMALLEDCVILITNDSGPMHLAAALGVPQVAIFGSTSDIATGPLSEVARVVKNPVDCSPCFLRECPIDFRCMRGVAVDQVLDQALQLLPEG